MEYTYNPVTKTALTKIAIGEGRDIGGEPGKRVLEIDTAKGYRGGTIKTAATVFLVTATGTKQHCFGIGGAGGNDDFKAVLKVEACKRVTEKAVRAQHEACAPLFAEIAERAKVFYFARDRQKAAKEIEAAGIGTPL